MNHGIHDYLQCKYGKNYHRMLKEAADGTSDDTTPEAEDAAKRERLARKAQIRREQAALKREPAATTLDQLKNVTFRNIFRDYWIDNTRPFGYADNKPSRIKKWLDDTAKATKETVEQLPNVTLGDYLNQHATNFKNVGSATAEGLNKGYEAAKTGAAYAGAGLYAGADALTEAVSNLRKPATLTERLRDGIGGMYSKSKKFLAKNPEYLWGAGGMMAGAGLGSLVSPKNKLAGLILGSVLGGAAGYGGKVLYDKYNA